MKKLLCLALLACAGFGSLRAQTVAGTVNLSVDLGLLSNFDGSGLLADGSLIQIVAAYNGTTLAAPTPTDFFGGSTGQTILWSGAFDSSITGTAGTTTISISGITVYADGTVGDFLTAGDALFVRWFPSLSGDATVPGVTMFGQYGYSSISDAVLDTSWVLPGAGANSGVTFLTEGVSGTLADSLGYASSSTSAVPEPATTAALLGLAALGVCWGARRRALRAV